MATATTATRKQLLKQRVAELENTVAQLIRATSAATHRLGSNAGFSARQANEWWTWQRLGTGPRGHHRLVRPPAALGRGQAGSPVALPGGSSRRRPVHAAASCSPSAWPRTSACAWRSSGRSSRSGRDQPITPWPKVYMGWGVDPADATVLAEAIRPRP